MASIRDRLSHLLHLRHGPVCRLDDPDVRAKAFAEAIEKTIAARSSRASVYGGERESEPSISEGTIEPPTLSLRDEYEIQYRQRRESFVRPAPSDDDELIPALLRRQAE